MLYKVIGIHILNSKRMNKKQLEFIYLPVTNFFGYIFTIHLF